MCGNLFSYILSHQTEPINTKPIIKIVLQGSSFSQITLTNCISYEISGHTNTAEFYVREIIINNCPVQIRIFPENPNNGFEYYRNAVFSNSDGLICIHSAITDEDSFYYYLSNEEMEKYNPGQKFEKMFINLIQPDGQYPIPDDFDLTPFSVICSLQIKWSSFEILDKEQCLSSIDRFASLIYARKFKQFEV